MVNESDRHRLACFSPAFVILAVLIQLFAVQTQLTAQDKDDTAEETKPVDPLLATIHVASWNRVLGDVDYLFEAVDRPEFSEFIRSFLANVRDLKGIDHDKPFGVLVFFKPGLSLEPEPIGFAPVADFDELKKTLEAVQATVSKVDGEDDMYEIKGRRHNYARLINGYAYISENPDALDRDFPDPASRTKKLSEKFDIAAAINVSEVPIGIRTLFLNFLKASSETELQQRDEESDGAYRLRKANGDASLELIEQLLTHGESVTLGFKLDRDGKGAHVELDVKARPASPFAQMLTSVGGKRSHFANVLDADVPFTFSVSWQMGKSAKKVASELAQAAERGLEEQLKEVPELDQIKTIFSSVNATIEEGHVDLFAQFRGEKRQGFALLAGLKIERPATFAAGILPFLKRMKQDPNIAEVDIAMAQHLGVTFHRIRSTKVRPQDQNLYGNQPSLYFGSGNDVLWFAIGEKPAFEQLKTLMEAVAVRPDTATLNRKNAPIQLRINIGQWLVLVPDDRPRPFADMAKETFKSDNDMLQLDLRPTENGLKLKFHLQQGFVKLLGKSLVRGIERRQGL